MSSLIAERRALEKRLAEALRYDGHAVRDWGGELFLVIRDRDTDEISHTVNVTRLAAVLTLI